MCVLVFRPEWILIIPDSGQQIQTPQKVRYRSLEMECSSILWSTQLVDIWDVANKLQQNAVQVDVYLETVSNEVKSENGEPPWTSSDGSIKFGGRTVAFPAHRIMLAAASPFLLKLLQEHYCDYRDPCPTITLPNVSPGTLRHILNFLYCGKASVPLAEKKQVFEVSQLLQIMDLVSCLESDGVAEENVSNNVTGKSEKNIDMVGKKGESASNKGGSLEVRECSVTCTEESICKNEKIFNSRPCKNEKITNTRPCKNEKCVNMKPSSERPQEMNLYTVRTQKNLQKKKLFSCDSSPNLALKKKNETSAHIADKACHGRQLGRSCRKIRNRYSSDVYELSLPKLRKCRRKNVSDTPVKRSNLEKKLESGKHTDAWTEDSFNNSVVHIPVESSYNHVSEQKMKNVSSVADDDSGSSFSRCFNIPSESPSKSDKSVSHLSALAVTSKPGMSPLNIPHLFCSDTPYLQDMAEQQNLPNLCSSYTAANVSPESVAKESSVISQNLSLLPPRREVVASSVSQSDVSIKQATDLYQCQESPKNPYDVKCEDNYEEDGLFKFQVLIKDCEALAGSTTSVQCEVEGGETEEGTGKHQEPDEGVDINQWISEEIDNYLQSRVSTADTSSHASTQVEPLEGQSSEMIEAANQDGRNEDSKMGKKISYECDQCGKKFSDLRNCQSHSRLVHREARQMCRFCGRMFKRRCDLYQHERRHKAASLPCQLCGKIFKLPKDLAAHMTTHTGEKRFTCNLCSKELTSVRNLKNHIASIHQKQRSFACHFCSKRYSKSSSLQVHIRSVHTRERPFKCSVCNKTFCDSALLKLHKNIHTGEQKYSCKICGRRFAQYSNMKSHHRIHTGQEPFTCIVCKEDFKTIEELLKHRWTHAGQKPLQCRHCCKEFTVKENFERHILSCHDDLISLPKIYLEVPDEIVLPDGSLEISSCGVIGTSSQQDPPSLSLSNNLRESMEVRDDINKELMEDMTPIVHLVRRIREETGQVQITYPLLSPSAEFEESRDIPLSGISGKVTTMGNDQSIDVHSLLQEEVSRTGSSSLIVSENQTLDDLSVNISEAVNSDCKEVVILDKFSSNSREINDIHSSPAIKVWITSDTPVIENDSNLNDKANIFIVSDQTFSETTHTLPVLSSDLVSPVVQTVILNRSESDL